MRAGCDRKPSQQDKQARPSMGKTGPAYPVGMGAIFRVLYRVRGSRIDCQTARGKIFATEQQKRC